MDPSSGTAPALRERLSYGLFFFGQNMIFVLGYQFLSLFCTDELEIAPAATGLIFLIVRIWDAVCTISMGFAVDKAQWKRGKYLPWVNISIMLIPLITGLMFTDWGGSVSFKVAYIFVLYLAFTTFYVIFDIPIFAFVNAATDIPEERNRMVSIGRVFSGAGSVAVAYFTMPLILRLGWTRAIWILCGVCFAAMLPLRLFGRERVSYSREPVRFRDLVGTVMKNKYLLIFLAGQFISGVCNTSGAVANYFSIYNLGNPDYVSVVNVIMYSGMFIIPLFLPQMIKWIGKKNTLILFLTISIASFLALRVVGYRNIYLTFFLLFTASCSRITSIIHVMFTTDCIEYGEYRTGSRSEGTIFAVQMFAGRISMAISGSLAPILLQLSGYVANAEQTPRALNGIFNLFCLLPAAGMAAMLVIMAVFYKLREKDVAHMMEEVRQRKLSQASGAAAEG